MGDVHDPSAPGNVFKITTQWPPAHTPTRYYFKSDYTLSTEAPASTQASVHYRYDPKDPTPSCGGAFSYSATKKNQIPGPLDQRAIKDRTDLARFYSAILDTPIEITGELKAELYISTDVPDTTFIVRLIDVYPDGYEMFVREGVFMARYHDGMDKPHPLQKDKIYKLAFDLSCTAIAFNKGHKIGVFITSASVPAYEAHPNSYEQVSRL